MFRFIISCSFFLLLSWGAHAQTVECKPQTAGAVRIVWSSDKIDYNFNKTQSQMDAMQVDTVSPYAASAKTHVGGLMHGGISVRLETQLSTSTYQKARMVCLWVDNVNINIAIDPTIYIAKQYKQGSCEHNAILEHEYKHIQVDREIVKKYAPQIKKVIEKAIQDIGIVGPKQERDKSNYSKKISDYLDQQLKIATDTMYAERDKRQQAVDTLAEYERVAGLCQ